MKILCEQLCIESHEVINTNSITIARDIMNITHKHLVGCDKTTYTAIFVHAAALSTKIDKALRGQEVLPGEHWAEFIGNNLRIN